MRNRTPALWTNQPSLRQGGGRNAFVKGTRRRRRRRRRRRSQCLCIKHKEEKWTTSKRLCHQTAFLCFGVFPPFGLRASGKGCCHGCQKQTISWICCRHHFVHFGPNSFGRWYCGGEAHLRVQVIKHPKTKLPHSDLLYLYNTVSTWECAVKKSNIKQSYLSCLVFSFFKFAKFHCCLITENLSKGIICGVLRELI